MRTILQRVSRGSVSVDGHTVGAIDTGFVALVGVTHADTPAHADLLARKTAHLRVFEDDAGKLNRSLLEVGGGVLVISQFTLYADAKKGRRPSFVHAARPQHAEPLVRRFAERLRAHGVPRVEMGVFGAVMLVEIHNLGPVTIILDTDHL